LECNKTQAQTELKTHIFCHLTQQQGFLKLLRLLKLMLIGGVIIIVIISGMHHYECVVPNVDIILQSENSEPHQLLRSERGSLIPGPAG